MYALKSGLIISRRTNLPTIYYLFLNKEFFSRVLNVFTCLEMIESVSVNLDGGPKSGPQTRGTIFSYSVYVCVFNMKSCHMTLTLGRVPLLLHIIRTLSQATQYFNNMNHGQNLSSITTSRFWPVTPGSVLPVQEMVEGVEVDGEALPAQHLCQVPHLIQALVSNPGPACYLSRRWLREWR